MAGDAEAQEATASAGRTDTEGDSSSTPRPRRDRRALWERALLVAGLLLTALGLSIVVACFINDRTIEESRGTSVAEVVDTSFFRTVVRFSTDEGKVYIPRNGVLYPAGLKEDQLVRVEYDSRNPELVRVAGRTMVLSLLPVFSSLAIVWAVVLTGVWMLRRRSRDTEGPNRAGEPGQSS